MHLTFQFHKDSCLSTKIMAKKPLIQVFENKKEEKSILQLHTSVVVFHVCIKKRD